ALQLSWGLLSWTGLYFALAPGERICWDMEDWRMLLPGIISASRYLVHSGCAAENNVLNCARRKKPNTLEE
ncbi:MAG: hypothetical protein IKO13_01285, partial [Oscillospiraceae bacterium]|nr:hypothetical protein [Oscillospiraceae bacterium]